MNVPRVKYIEYNAWSGITHNGLLLPEKEQLVKYMAFPDTTVDGKEIVPLKSQLSTYVRNSWYVALLTNDKLPRNLISLILTLVCVEAGDVAPI